MLRYLLLTCQIWCFAGRVCHPSHDLFLLSKPLPLTDFCIQSKTLCVIACRVLFILGEVNWCFTPSQPVQLYQGDSDLGDICRLFQV